MKEYLEMNVLNLGLGRNITNKLINNNIETVLNLCNYSRLELVDLEFYHNEINQIVISLQLLGLDLKKNHAKRNTILDGILK